MDSDGTQSRGGLEVEAAQRTANNAPLSDDVLSLELSHDVYSFACLLYQREHWRQLHCGDKFVVVTFTAISFIVQMTSMAMLWYIGAHRSESANHSMDGKLLCDDSLIGEACTFYEHNFVYAGQTPIAGYIARAISISLVWCFVYPSMSNVTQYTLLMQDAWFSSNRKTVIPWTFLALFEGFTLIVVVFVVSRIVLFSTSLLDVLSVGVGFIILMEVDDHLYVHAKRLTYKGIDIEKLFHVELNRNGNWFLRRSIFHYCTEQTYSAAMYWLASVGSVWAVTSLCIRYQLWPDEGYAYWHFFDGTLQWLLGALLILLPWIPVRNCICKD